MTKYQISFVTATKDHFQGQAETRQIITSSGILYDKMMWYMGRGNTHYWNVECDNETLAMLVLRGAQVRLNLTQLHLEELAKARITGYNKLTPLEREALELKEPT